MCPLAMKTDVFAVLCKTLPCAANAKWLGTGSCYVYTKVTPQVVHLVNTLLTTLNHVLYREALLSAQE